MDTIYINEKYKIAFKTNIRNLFDSYIDDEGNDAKSYANVHSHIMDYCERNKLRSFKESTLKKWFAGEVIPDSYFICLLCEFFGCDANYLFDIDSIEFKTGPEKYLSKADKYIFETYGLDKKTLDFFKEYKDCGINTIDDSDVPHSASDSNQSFSSLFNDLIHQSPWVINALLQIIYAKRLNLSSYGLEFDEVDERIVSQPEFPGISRHLLQDFDIDVALSLLAIRIKQLHQNPDYMPCETNLIETYDSELLKPGAVDDYISALLSTRLKNLNSEIEELTIRITE